MFLEKVPYGVKVRVKGDDIGGYVAQYALHCSRIFPASWTSIVAYTSDLDKAQTCFTTFEEAHVAAVEEYNRWIAFYKRNEERKKEVKKVSNKVVWKNM